MNENLIKTLPWQWINPKHPALWWLSITAVVLLFAWVTLPVSPSIYPDEPMVADYGRNVLDYPTDWSVVWNFATDSPRVPAYWLGGVIQEWACRISGLSFLGARLSGVLGSVAAATFFLFWMRTAGVPAWIGMAGAFAFLSDPLLVAVSRSGRADTWVMTLVLASCWLVRMAANQARGGGWPVGLMAVAGICAAVAPFCWISAVFPLLLVAAELLRFAFRKDLRWRGALASAWAPWAVFALAGILTTLALVGFVWPIWREAIPQTLWITDVAATSGTLHDLGPFLASFRANPLLLPAVLFFCVVLWKADRLLFSVVVVTTFFMLQSLAYHFRVAYALPVYYAAVTVGCGVLISSGKVRRYRIVSFVLGALLIWNAAVSFGLRGWIAASRAADNNPKALQAAAETHIGAGPHTVFDANMVFYYAGRKLGWRMYRPEVAHNYGLSKWDDGRFVEFLRRVDVAIVPQPGQVWNAERFSKDEAGALTKAGFQKRSSFTIGDRAQGNRAWWDRVLLGGGPDYGAFDVYARPRVALPEVSRAPENTP